MNIWGILGIVVAVISFIWGVVYKINNYIDESVEVKYQQKVADFMLQKQNQALKEWEINTKLFKENKDIKKQEIISKVEYIKVKDDTCEAKLEVREKLQDIIYIK